MLVFANSLCASSRCPVGSDQLLGNGRGEGTEKQLGVTLTCVRLAYHKCCWCGCESKRRSKSRRERIVISNPQDVFPPRSSGSTVVTCLCGMRNLPLIIQPR